MNETSPVQKQDITPIVYKLDTIIKLLEELIKVVSVREETSGREWKVKYSAPLKNSSS